jgi:hypothetical protein
MKKIGFFLLAFFLIWGVSSVYGQRGNPYHPYNPYIAPGVAAPEQQKFQETYQHEANFYSNPYGLTTRQRDPRYYLYERDYLTRPYLFQFRKGLGQDNYFVNPYGTIPGRWYDTQLDTNTGGGSGRGYEISGMLTSPYEETYLRQKQSGQTDAFIRNNYSSDSEYTTVPYGSDPRRWYDTPTSGQGTSQRSLEPVKTLSGPSSIKEAPALSSNETLTSPFEKGVPPTFRRTETPPSYTQELTPPVRQ